jgi:ketosteroid isomerase-like protein
MTLATVLLFLCLIAPAASEPASPAVKAILDLEKQFTAALLERDSAAMDGLLADDLVHIGFEGQIVGKAEYMSFFKQGDWRYSRYETSNLSVKAFADSAVVTGRVDRTIKVGGKETAGAFAFSHVWVRAGDRWRLSSSHITTISQ